MPALRIARINHEEDVFAADETKVHTLSHQVISEMLDTAERREAASSAPPPPSGTRTRDVREAEERRPAPTKSGMMPAIPRAAAIPAVSYEEDEEGLEPTTLSERASASAMLLPRPQLVTELLADPPRIIEPSRPPSERETLAEIAPTEHAAVGAAVAPVALVPVRRGIDRRALAITVVTFIATLLPALVLLQHFIAR